MTVAAETWPTRGHLIGTLVIDLSRGVAGPHAAMLLGDLGARVIKVVSASGWDESRYWGPSFVDSPQGRRSMLLPSAHRNKESVSVDLRSEEGLEVLTNLVRRADVLVENLRHGVMERLGLGQGRLRQLNPRLVVLSITGSPQDGPEAERPAGDNAAQKKPGQTSIAGADPQHVVEVGVVSRDVVSGVYGAHGVLGALRQREQSGLGDVVRVSRSAAISGAHAGRGARWTAGREVSRPGRSHGAAIAPYGMFRCADGSIQIAVANQDQWMRLCRTLDLDPEHPAFHDNEARVANLPALLELLEAALAGADRVTWLNRFSAAGLQVGRMATLDEVRGGERTRRVGLVMHVDHPNGRPLDISGPARGFDDGRHNGHGTAPRPGRHDTVREWLPDGAADGSPASDREVAW